MPAPVSRAIFLDSNAGAPLSPRASGALLSLLGEKAGFVVSNPSSIHSYGRNAKRRVAEAREKIALSLGSRTDPEQLIFTSSGSEANQQAIRSILEPRFLLGEKPHWITTPVEHDSVLQMVEWVRARGGSVSFLPLSADGRPDVSAFGAFWKPETALVSAVWAGNETGILTDVSALSAAVRSRGGVLHLDAAQVWGKIPLELGSVGAQLISFSAHKIGGLAGLGVLWVAPGTRVTGLVAGKQEKGRRGGTENVLGIIAAGEAASGLEPEAWAAHVGALRDRLEHAICERINGVIINGGQAPRIANTLSLCFDEVEGDGMVMALDLAGYCVSSGSACSSGATEPSHVLVAMGRNRGQAMAAIRVSLSGDTQWSELEGFVGALEKIVARIRAAARRSQTTETRENQEQGIQA